MSGEDYIMRSFIICTLRQLSIGWQHREEWYGWACSTYGGQKKCIEVFGGETCVKETTWKKNHS